MKLVLTLFLSTGIGFAAQANNSDRIMAQAGSVSVGSGQLTKSDYRSIHVYAKDGNQTAALSLPCGGYIFDDVTGEKTVIQCPKSKHGPIRRIGAKIKKIW